MSQDLLEVNQLIEKIEYNLKHKFVISTSFKDIQEGKLNFTRRRFMIFVYIILLVNILRSFIGTFVPGDSLLHFYSVNPLIGFGFLGRFMSCVFISGYIGMILHSLVYFRGEKNKDLAMITNLKEMFQNLKNPTKQEIRNFVFFLKFISYIRVAVWIIVTFPLAFFRAVGAVVTAFHYNYLPFILMYVPFWLYFIPIINFCGNIYGYTHLFIAQSTAYFRIRMNRINKYLDDVLLLLKSRVQRMERMRNKTKAMYLIHQTLIEMEQILNEVKDHNRCIKHFLRDGLMSMGCVYACTLVFVLGDNPWYIKLFLIATFFVVGVILGTSFFNVSGMVGYIRETSKLLHSVQVCLQNETPTDQTFGRRQSAPLSNRFDSTNRALMLKIKFQILRMIHRVSSPYLRIGFTVGEGESFDRLAAGSFVTTTMSTTIMFMNSKSSLINYLRNI